MPSTLPSRTLDSLYKQLGLGYRVSPRIYQHRLSAPSETLQVTPTWFLPLTNPSKVPQASTNPLGHARPLLLMADPCHPTPKVKFQLFFIEASDQKLILS